MLLAFVSADVAKAQVDNTVKVPEEAGRQGHTIGIGAGARPGAGQAPQWSVPPPRLTAQCVAAPPA
ncbi:hypothetical protein [Streptomyces sp. P9-2]|uniref:hypothetical protein n=1 Tax=Streptomyces sp. P9-2 TaxID=3423201 RepID=UPI003F748651